MSTTQVWFPKFGNRSKQAWSQSQVWGHQLLGCWLGVGGFMFGDFEFQD